MIPRMIYTGLMSHERMRSLIPEAGRTEKLDELEQQFAEKHLLPLEKGEILEYTLVHQTNEGEQAEWTVIVGGFSSTKEMWREEILDLAQSGKCVVFVTPDKGITPNEDESDYFKSDGKTIPFTIQRKAVAVKRLIDHLGIHMTNLVGQSQGALVTTSLAGMYPTLIKSMLLDNPAGISKDSALGFYARAVIESAHEQFSAPKAKVGEIHPELLKEDKAIWDTYNEKFARHRMWRLAKEVPDIGRANLLPVLEGIKKYKAETKSEFPEVILLNANSDKLFHADLIEKAIGETPVDQFVDRWIMYADKDTGHSKYRRPQPGMLPQVFSENRRNTAIKQILGEGK